MSEETTNAIENTDAKAVETAAGNTVAENEGDYVFDAVDGIDAELAKNFDAGFGKYAKDAGVIFRAEHFLDFGGAFVVIRL